MAANWIYSDFRLALEWEQFLDRYYFRQPQRLQPQQRQPQPQPLGKKHALKKYDQFTLNTSCIWGSIYPNCAISRILCLKNNE